MEKPFHNLSYLNKKSVQFGTRKIHGLWYQDPNTSETEFEDFLTILTYHTKDIDVIYTKGSQKREWLEQNIPFTSIIDIEDLGEKWRVESNIDFNPPSCIYHQSIQSVNPVRCSKANVEKLYYWLQQILPLPIIIPPPDVKEEENEEEWNDCIQVS